MYFVLFNLHHVHTLVFVKSYRCVLANNIQECISCGLLRIFSKKNV